MFASSSPFLGDIIQVLPYDAMRGDKALAEEVSTRLVRQYDLPNFLVAMVKFVIFQHGYCNSITTKMKSHRFQFVRCCCVCGQLFRETNVLSKFPKTQPKFLKVHL